jgi:hypothetical protein
VCGTFPRSMPRLSGARSLRFRLMAVSGSNLTGGWGILLYEKVALLLLAYEHQHHICLNLYEVRLHPCRKEIG